MGDLSFASPALLFALIALPAIWFLLRATPPTPQSVSFPAFDLLRRLTKTQETPHRTPWWLLLLRLAIAALAIVGLAGPILNAPPPPVSSGPLVIVVDNSWLAAPGWRLRRDAVRTAGEQAARADREIYFIATADGDDTPIGPMTGGELMERAGDVQPQPTRPDYRRAAKRLNEAGAIHDADIIWLSDGMEHDGAEELIAAMKRLGNLTVSIDAASPLLALFPPTRAESALTYRIANAGGAPWKGDIAAFARGGRELARATFEIGPNSMTEASLDLPLALQNDMTEARLENISSAGAVQLVDARERRALIGFVASGESNVDPLLAGQHYVKQALAPYALFVTDSLDGLIAAKASVIILDDIGVLRGSDEETLRAWMEKGGVVIRFAGPTLAEAAEDGAPPLLPVPLRGGGRAFGGALTWDTPQELGVFAESGPFAGLAAPDDVFIRRQVLAEPGGETSEKSWASLADGTPLVTGERNGAGVLALFHVTATPDWSDLPLSETFIEMLRKLVFLSTIGPEGIGNSEAQTLSLFRVLDGFGVLRRPAQDFAPTTLAELEKGPAPERPPGLYGAPDAPIALNAVRSEDSFKPFDARELQSQSYEIDPPVRIGPPLFIIALLLLIADAVVALKIAGRLALFAIAAAFIVPMNARAQPLDRPIDNAAMDAALSMRLAYVRTGDPATDRISEAGLKSLTRELASRTSAEPAAPEAVDPETDNLAVYPFLYWPVTAGAAAPSDSALANIETFMRFGGLVLFDTRDDERAINGVETPEGYALKTILARLDLPPLTPVTDNHVLNRSFYLLSDLPGRMATRPVWVMAGDGPNDSVTPVIIGGRDWAGAWASNDVGEPLLPVRAGARPCNNSDGAIPRNARECAYRAGVNMVMVALTGNYKSDQVHTPVLLERLGRQ